MIVTDHALLRYFERVLDIDIEAARAALAQHVIQHMEAGCTSWRAPEATYCFREGRLITVLPAGVKYRPQADFS